MNKHYDVYMCRQPISEYPCILTEMHDWLLSMERRAIWSSILKNISENDQPTYQFRRPNPYKSTRE